MPSRENDFQPPSQGVADHLRRPAVLLLILCSLTFLIYSATLQFEFVWDDEQQIVNNPLIRSFSTVPRAFTSDLWCYTSRVQLYYRPLFLCWSILNYALFGLQPWGWHLGAVLLHILAIPAVYVLARRLNIDHWTAAIAVAIFALHPIHVECVSWISAASDTMVTVFYVFAFIAFLKSREICEPHRLTWQIAALLMLAAALFTKEMALTFAMMAAIHAFLFPAPASIKTFTGRTWHALSACFPYAILTFCYAVLRRLALHHVTGTFDPTHSLTDVLITLPSVLFQYLRLLLLPVGLTGLYYTKYVDTVTGFVFPLIGLGIFGTLIWIWHRRTGDRVVQFAAMWSLITLIPVLYLRAFVNDDLVRDRYVYLPSVGFVLLATKAIRLLPRLRTLSSTAVQLGAVGVVTAALMVGSISQQVYWANDLLLFSRGHTLYPQYNFATLGLAYAVGKQGAYDGKVRLLREILKNNPRYGRAYYDLTDAYVVLGQRALARQTLEDALAVDPGFVASPAGMATLAALYTGVGDYDRARELCSQVLAREPDLYAAVYNCGNTEFLSGNDKEAEKLLSRAVRVSPDLAEPNYFLGRTLLRMRRQADAERYLTVSATLQPRSYEYHYWLGQALELRGALSDARQQYLLTLKLNPSSEEAKQRLAALDQPTR